MNRFLRTIILLIIVAIAAIFLLRQYNPFTNFKNPFAEEPVTIDPSPVIIRQIKEIAQLMTVETYDEIVMDSARVPKTQIPVIAPFGVFSVPGINKIVLIIKGRTLAGLDLKELQPEDIQPFKKDSITIQLPRAKILEVIVNPSDVETFIEKGEWSPEAVTILKKNAQIKMVRNALEQNVLPKAEEKAITLVADLLRNSGFKKVTVTVKHR